MNTLSPKRTQINGKWSTHVDVSMCQDRRTKATARRIVADEACRISQANNGRPINMISLPGQQAGLEVESLARGVKFEACIGLESDPRTAVKLRNTYAQLGRANPQTRFSVIKARDVDVFTRNTDPAAQQAVKTRHGIHLTWLDWWGPWDKTKAHTLMALITRAKEFFRPVHKQGCNPLLYLTINIGMERKDDMSRLLGLIPTEIRTQKILPRGDTSNTYVVRMFGLLHQLNQWLYWEDMHAEMRQSLIYSEPPFDGKGKRGQLMLLIGFEIMKGTLEPECLNHEKEIYECGAKRVIPDSGTVKFRKIPLA